MDFYDVLKIGKKVVDIEAEVKLDKLMSDLRGVRGTGLSVDILPFFLRSSVFRLPKEKPAAATPQPVHIFIFLFRQICTPASSERHYDIFSVVKEFVALCTTGKLIEIVFFNLNDSVFHS